MARKRYTAEEIIGQLRTIEIELGKGLAVVDAGRKLGITEQTYYRWKKEYGVVGQCRAEPPNIMCPFTRMTRSHCTPRRRDPRHHDDPPFTRGHTSRSRRSPCFRR